MGRRLYSRSLAIVGISVVLVTLETNSCVEPVMPQIQGTALWNEVLAWPGAANEGGSVPSRTEAEGSPPFPVTMPELALGLVGGLVPSVRGISVRADERVGWLAGTNPPASVSLTYDVSSISASYRDTLQSVRISAAAPGLTPFPIASPFTSAAASVAEFKPQVRDPSGTYQITDKSRMGFAFTGGIGGATTLSNLSAAMNGDVPRGSVFPNTGYIPGNMSTNLLAQGVNLGVEWRY